MNPGLPEQSWEWLYESRIDTRRALLRCEPYTSSVTYADMRITWTVHPVSFLPMADQRETELLPGAGDLQSAT